jgi:excisionase family DNA binding protein
MTDSPTQTLVDPPAATGAYTIADIARMAQCSERHAWRLTDRNLIPGRIQGLGRLVRFSRAAVDAWLAGQTTGRR